MKWTAPRLRRLLNFYPPYLGAGVRVTYLAADWREAHVSMKLRWYNKNALGTHFGGSLYSMVDPHLVLLFMHALGEDYVVWDKAADIRFLRPGTGTVRAVLRLTGEDLETARRATADGAIHLPEFDVEILNESDAVVASVHKMLYIRRRQNQGEKP